MQTACVFHLDEIDGVSPSDSARNIADLVPPSGLTAPTRGEGITGHARVWAAAQGLKGAELVTDALRLRRSMSVEILVYPAGGDGTRYLVQRGANTGAAAERILWGLKLGITAGLATLTAHWQKASGAAASVSGATFTPPPGWLLLGAVRRWISATEVEVDYYVNGEPIGTVSSSDGDISDGDGGTFYLGVNDGSGTPATGMIATDAIDTLRVSNVARSAEEIRQVYRRFFVFTGWGGDVMRQLVPPGVYSTDPSSRVQRELATEGDALATAWALAGELGDDFLPDRATRTLDRWEAVTRLAPGPSDTIAQRRARIVAHLQKIHGFSRAKIADAIAPLLDVAPGAVSIVERSNRFSDDFSAGAIGARWVSEPNAGTVAQAAGLMALDFQAADDARWTGAVATPVRVRCGIDAYELVQVVASITARSLANTHDLAGIFIWDFGTLNAHLWGIRWTGAAYEFVQRKIEGGAVVTTGYASPAVPGGTLYLRMAHDGAGRLNLDYSTTGVDGPWTTVVTSAPTIPSFYWAGVCLVSEEAAATNPSSADFGDFALWMPRSLEVFSWYVDEAGLPATADLASARAVVETLKPAHTRGVMRGTVFLTDDPNSLTDQDVLGG